MTFNAKAYLFKPDYLLSWLPAFNHDYVDDKYKTPIDKDYRSTLYKKNKIECETIKKLYNKYESKKFFESFGLNVPTLYYYTNAEKDIGHILSYHKKYVAKPAHMSESDGIFINDKNYEKVNESLNHSLKKTSRLTEPKMMKETEKGMLIEEYIEYDYEFKVFVLYGCPIVGDLRDGPKEWHRIDMIDIKNQYFNWDKEYDICKQIAKELRIDFFRIDFFYSKKEDKFYAGEMAFRPSTLLGNYIEEHILLKWREMTFNEK